MANIADDATRTEFVRTDTSDPYTGISYTPTTTPRGIVLTAIHADSSTDYIWSHGQIGGPELVFC